jgi:hypothetical protein
MSCQEVRKLIAPFLDQDLAGEQREHVLKHLAFCRECSAQFNSLDKARNALRALKPRPMPARLVAQLRILASHEQVRRVSRASLGAALRCWRSNLGLLMDNLMRPLALPFAGGVISALVMFSMLVPTLNFRHNFHNDVPIVSGIYTDASLTEISPFCNGADETVLELTIDERGQLTDYRVSEGEMSKELANDLLFTVFSPATIFGQPVSTKLYLTFRRSRTITVKG